MRDEGPITLEELTEAVGPYWAERLMERSDIDKIVFITILERGQPGLTAWQVMKATA